MTQTALTALLEKYLNESASPDEVRQLRNLLKNGEHEAYTKDWIEKFLAKQQSEAYTDFDVQDMFREVIEKSGMPARRVHFMRTAWFRYAAVLLLIAGTAAVLYITNTRAERDHVQQSTNVQPGVNRATLTLADGSTIVLDSNANNALAEQGNTKIIKLTGGTLAYYGGATHGEVLFNTISTPRGGQYQVMLPDGSQVWLNAASSVRFPVNFDKNERRLTVSGEVYIEVKKDAARPFYVNTGEIEVDVLGTSFNINAYTEEAAIKTTLLEGAVKLRQGTKEGVLLRPGQQGVAESGKDGIVVRAADIEEVLAWKNGLFKFNNTNIDVVLRQVARWYDLEIVYQGVHPADKFGGEIPRKASVEGILEMISTSGVKLRREGRKVIVL